MGISFANIKKGNSQKRRNIPECPPSTSQLCSCSPRCTKTPRPARSCDQTAHAGWGRSCCPQTPSDCDIVRSGSVVRILSAIRSHLIRHRARARNCRFVSPYHNQAILEHSVFRSATSTRNYSSLAAPDTDLGSTFKWWLDQRRRKEGEIP